MSISKLVLFGNDPRCSRCNVFKPVWNSKELKDYAASVGAEMIDAGQTLFPAVYNAWMVKAKALGVKVVAFPDLMVLDNSGKVVGHFNPSGTAKVVIGTLKGLCTDCGLVVPPVKPPVTGCTPGTMYVCPECQGKKKIKCETCGSTVKCPTCKGKGKVACG